MAEAYPFLKPIVAGWANKLGHARDAKKAFSAVAKQCEMFFSGDMGFMWKPEFRSQFLGGNISPKFKITIAKAFELVAVIGPVLFWRYPQRQIRNFKSIELSPYLFGSPDDQAAMEMYQQAVSQMQAEAEIDSVRNSLMEKYLNYTPREQPGTLAQHAELAITEALVKGRGLLWCEPYTFPGSNRTLTGGFYDSVDNLLIDPDCTDPTLRDAKWIARRHCDPVWEVERRFGLPDGSLAGKGHLESTERQSEDSTAEDKMWRQVGKTFDLMVWYEIWSRGGVGTRLQNVTSSLDEKFEEVVGDYAYVCIARGVDYPLNCPLDFLAIADNDEVQERLSWPYPTYLDDRFPVAVLDFYPKPNSPWPIAPLAMGLGELTFLNVMMSLLCNRVYSSSRDIIAYMKSAASQVENQLKSGEYQCFIEINDQMQKSIGEMVQFLQQPSVNYDVFRMIEVVSEMFDKRVGLTELAYGLNPGGVQSRTAADITAKQENLSVRPDHMAARVESWQTNLAEIEKFAARWFVEPEDVRPLLGGLGAALWERLISTEDPEVCVRSMRATIEAGSTRKPNKQRDTANLNQALQWILPVLQQYAQLTGNSEPMNEFFRKWGDATDMDLQGLTMERWEPRPPSDQEQQMLQQQQEQAAAMQAQEAQRVQQEQAVEQQKVQLEFQFKQMEMQAKMLDMEVKKQSLQAAQQKMLIEQLKAQQELALSQQDMQLKQQELSQDVALKQAELQQDMQLKLADLHQEAMLQEEKNRLQAEESQRDAMLREAQLVGDQRLRAAQMAQTAQERQQAMALKELELQSSLAREQQDMSLRMQEADSELERRRSEFLYEQARQQQDLFAKQSLQDINLEAAAVKEALKLDSTLAMNEAKLAAAREQRSSRDSKSKKKGS